MDGAGDIQHYYAADGLDSVNWTVKHWMDSSGNFAATNSLRAPMFYDLNNTGYYVDPSHSTTSAKFAGGITMGPYKQFITGDLGASGAQANTYEIAKIAFDYNDWAGGQGELEVELHTTYYNSGIKKRYSVSVGYYNHYSAKLLEFTGNGDNNAQVRIGTPVLVSGDIYTVSVYVDVRYYSYVTAKISTMRAVTGSSSPNAGQTYINIAPSAVSISDFTADTLSFHRDAQFDSLRSTIYYDSNDTGYYVDPNSTGLSLSSNGIVSSGTGVNGGFQNRTYTGGRNRIWSFGNADGYGISYFQGGPDYIGLHVSGSPTQANSDFWVSSTGVSQSSASSRAPIFYDSNDTGFYLNPSNYDSRMVGLNLYGGDSNNINDATLWVNKTNNADWGISVVGSSSATEYGIQMNLNGTHLYGYRGLVSGTEYTRSGTDLFYHSASVRAPIFYDYVNTSYYVDPNSAGTSINVAGSIIAGGNVTAYSDRRIKENIEPINNALSKVQQLNGVTFNRSDLSDNTKRYAGLIAQDIEAVLPEAVEGTSTLRVDYNATIGLLVEAIKELTAKVETLETKLAQKEH